MGFDTDVLMDCSSFVSAIGQMGYSAEEVCHAVSKLSEAVGSYSYVEGHGLSRQTIRLSTIVKMSIVRKPLVKFDETKSATFTVDHAKIDLDVLEKNFGPLNKGWNIL